MMEGFFFFFGSILDTPHTSCGTSTYWGTATRRGTSLVSCPQTLRQKKGKKVWRSKLPSEAPTHTPPRAWQLLQSLSGSRSHDTEVLIVIMTPCDVSPINSYEHTCFSAQPLGAHRVLDSSLQEVSGVVLVTFTSLTLHFSTGQVSHFCSVLYPGPSTLSQFSSS